MPSARRENPDREPGDRAASGLQGLLRPKGNLTRDQVLWLWAIAIAPLVSVAIRLMALPGLAGPGPLQGLGSALTDAFSLVDVPPDQREHVLYLLFLPTCALLVALARLTLGIRVLGFRSILISVGFRQSGILPSLLLIAVAIAVIVLVRPWMRRIRLPYYGRVSIILCIVALTMVGPILAGQWVLPGVLWGAAFFPVIVLGMLAEGVARTLDRDNVVAASWRAITTILLAFVSALIAWIPALQSLFLQYPELVLIEIVGIVFVSEYLDLRLLADWEARAAHRLLAWRRAPGAASRVAVVRNRIEGRSGRRARARGQALRSVQRIVDALRAEGHTVKVFEGDASLRRRLRRFLERPREEGPRGIVLNLAHGTHGQARTTHVPALLEMTGIPYVGPTPLGHAVGLDRFMARSLLQRAGVPTPAFALLSRPGQRPRGVEFPMVVHPRHEPGAAGRRVSSPRRLRAAVRRVIRRHHQEALVEEWFPRRRISAALIGNDPVECLPLVERARPPGEKTCPAPVEEETAERVRRHAIAAFKACACRDYARVDLAITERGGVRVLEVRTLGILAREGSFARAAREAGYPFEILLDRIIAVARARVPTREPGVARPRLVETPVPTVSATP